MKLNQKGTGSIEAIVTLIAVIVVGGSGYYVVNQNNKHKEATKPTQTSAPSQSTGSKPDTTVPNPSTDYLVIKEWGVKFKLTKNIKDAYYDHVKDIPDPKTLDILSLRTHSLDFEEQCKTDSQSIVTMIRVNKDEPYEYDKSKTYTEVIGSAGTLIGDYFYYMQGAQYGCALTEQGRAILDKVRSGFIEAGPTVLKI